MDIFGVSAFVLTALAWSSYAWGERRIFPMLIYNIIMGFVLALSIARLAGAL